MKTNTRLVLLCICASVLMALPPATVVVSAQICCSTCWSLYEQCNTNCINTTVPSSPEAIACFQYCDEVVDCCVNGLGSYVEWCQRIVTCTESC